MREFLPVGFTQVARRDPLLLQQWRTKIDDTRELLDDVQYALSRGRYKVYLYDVLLVLQDGSAEVYQPYR